MVPIPTKNKTIIKTYNTVQRNKHSSEHKTNTVHYRKTNTVHRNKYITVHKKNTLQYMYETNTVQCSTVKNAVKFNNLKKIR